ncbi:MAG: 23S rRNA (uracil(1939)-C(5))-methyltransferase RlmD [Lachnospiraceae bacterium]|nr:23S rRNA (uracil(1939)-C(5))-methyltransferase RlmD [Lachnospiraceae bacterium]
MEYRKNCTVEVEIIDMSENGEGIGRMKDGYTLFVKDAVIGDTVTAKLTKTKKHYAYAILTKLLTPSPFRAEPVCAEHRRCGGCRLQALSYEAQLSFKEKRVRDDLIRIGGFAEEEIDRISEPIIGMQDPWRYRNKAQYPVGYDNSSNIISGFYISRTHDIVAHSDCYLGPEEYKIIKGAIMRHLEKHQIAPYDEKTGNGLVRHILIRKGFGTGEIMICLVLNKKRVKPSAKGENGVENYIPAQNELIEALKRIPGVCSVCVNLNTVRSNVIMGPDTVTLWGSDVIRDVLCGLTFEISAPAFYQVNPVQTEKLYALVREFAGLTGKEEVWDICCGIGTITLALAGGAAKIHGLEIIPEAIEDAKRNAVLNHIENASFICAAAEEYLPLHQKELCADVIITDPPRKGMDERSLQAIAAVSPKKIVYVSCDPATLARDLKFLREKGYRLDRLRPVDMFPQTVHVETVCLLSRLSEAKHHIEVKVDMDELDLTSAEAKATYKEIQDWVQKKYGFHVTNLNIAQVKQKRGIIERENYNKAKSENSKQPGCPEEKVKAIEDAMRHFQMIP